MELTIQQFLEQYISSPFLVALIVIGLTWVPTFLPVPTETSSAFYVFLYKVLNAIAANVGNAKNANTPPSTTKSKTDTKNTMLVLLALGTLTLGGCALKNLEPHEQGLAVAEEVTTVYFALEEQYYDLPADVQPKVAPLLNKYRKTLILFRDSASLWYKTQEEPADFDMLYDTIGQLIMDIKAIIEEV